VTSVHDKGLYCRVIRWMRLTSWLYEAFCTNNCIPFQPSYVTLFQRLTQIATSLSQVGSPVSVYSSTKRALVIAGDADTSPSSLVFCSGIPSCSPLFCQHNCIFMNDSQYLSSHQPYLVSPSQGTLLQADTKGQILSL